MNSIYKIEYCTGTPAIRHSVDCNLKSDTQSKLGLLSFTHLIIWPLKLPSSLSSQFKSVTRKSNSIGLPLLSCTCLLIWKKVMSLTQNLLYTKWLMDCNRISINAYALTLAFSGISSVWHTNNGLQFTGYYTSQGLFHTGGWEGKWHP